MKTPANETSDLIEACKSGDPVAQQQLYENYCKAMFNVCMRMLRNRFDAEDILQDSFIDAFRHLDSYRYESTFGTWLKRIVINKCINHLKKQKCCFEFIEEMGCDYLWMNHDREPEYGEISVKQILRAMEQLSDGYRVIFSLYLLEGYDHEEISSILNISESTSRSQYLRAKNKLKNILMRDYCHALTGRYMALAN